MSIHPEPSLISRYAAGGADVDEATVWAVEAHLESCPTCRVLLADAVDSDTRELLRRVADGIATGIATGPPPARHRRLRRTGMVTRVLPWLATAATLMLAAVVFEQTFDALPSLVLLIAPVAPLLPVAAAWSRRTDAAWELLASVPRAGLGLLLRRTLAVLAAVIPLLAAAGWLTGHSPALWLLPCLAFTAATLALGGLVGVDRAAFGLTAAWSAVVVTPSVIAARLPGVLEPGSWPGWAVVTVVLLGMALVRSGDHRHLGSRRS